RSLYAIVILGAVTAVAACEQTSAPVRREILGTWLGEGIPGISVEMTLTETARAVEGAGGWTDGSGTFAFRVFGAIARDEVSLYLDFADREDITFSGVFPRGDEDRISGLLYGGGFNAAAAT